MEIVFMQAYFYYRTSSGQDEGERIIRGCYSQRVHSNQELNNLDQFIVNRVKSTASNCFRALCTTFSTNRDNIIFIRSGMQGLF